MSKNDNTKKQSKLIISSLDRHVKNIEENKYSKTPPEPIDKPLNLQFSKGLQHDKYGNVDVVEFQKLITAIETNDIKLLNDVKLAGELKLVTPSNVATVELFCPFKNEITQSKVLDKTPSVESDEAGTEMISLYHLSLLRDVPYTEWNLKNKLVRRAIKDLTGVSNRETGPITAENLFRYPTASRNIGPYVSQFLLHTVPYGSGNIIQKYKSPAAGKDYVTTIKNYLSLQNGTVLEKEVPTSIYRYIITPRDGIEYVHNDPPFQATYNAALILIGRKAPWNPLNPFFNGKIQNETNFIDLGLLDLTELISRTIRVSLLSSWYYKFFSRRLRPENMGYLIQLALQDNKSRGKFKDFPKLSNVILKSRVLERIYKKQKSYLLSQAYPEGCPLHPSANSGHAVFAWAGVTILKAFFDTSFQLDNIVVPTADGSSLDLYKDEKYTLTVEDELNKLAFNIGNWRQVAGIHYFSDSENGANLGEAVAISILEDAVKRYPYAAGYQLTKRNGKTILISNFDQKPVIKTPLKLHSGNQIKRSRKSKGNCQKPQ